MDRAPELTTEPGDLRPACGEQGRHADPSSGPERPGGPQGRQGGGRRKGFTRRTQDLPSCAPKHQAALPVTSRRLGHHCLQLVCQRGLAQALEKRGAKCPPKNGAA